MLYTSFPPETYGDGYSGDKETISFTMILGPLVMIILFVINVVWDEVLFVRYFWLVIGIIMNCIGLYCVYHENGWSDLRGDTVFATAFIITLASIIISAILMFIGNRKSMKL
jgi:hypothetical protein